MNDLFKLYIKCIVKIFSSSGSHGTGFFIAPSKILTCKHVVKNYDTVNIYWQQNNTKSISIKRFKDLDMALITIDNSIEHHCVMFDKINPKFDDILRFYGFPYSLSDGRPEKVTYVGLGKYKGIEILTLSGGQVDAGASGSPLLNINTSKVCGMVVLSKDYNSDLGGYGIPITTIKVKLHDLIRKHNEYHIHNLEWINKINNKYVISKHRYNLLLNEIDECVLLNTYESGIKLFNIINEIKNSKRKIPTIQNANFKNINFSLSRKPVDFSNCKISYSDFTSAILDSAKFKNGYFRENKYNLSRMNFAKFDNSNFRSCQFKSITAIGASFSKSDLVSAQFSDAQLAGILFNDCDLNDVDFSNANLNYANFQNAKNLTSTQLLKTKTLYLAKGINSDIIEEINIINPGLFLHQNDIDYIFGEKNKKTEFELESYLFKLINTMSEDSFQIFLSGVPKKYHNQFIESRNDAKKGIEPLKFFNIIKDKILKNKHLLKKRITISFKIVDEKRAYFIDSNDPKVISNCWKDDSDVGIITNKKTINDIMIDNFDYHNPSKGQLFLWGGDEKVLLLLSNILQE